MKFDFLQSDFSGGELSPSAQGHVDSDAYKAGLKLASNMVPTRAGSIASRAGGKWLADGFNATTGAASNAPVQHLDIKDSPFGDFVIEISQHTMRFMDRYGVRDWSLYQPSPLLRFNVQVNGQAWGDEKTRTVYLSNPSGVTQQEYDVTRGAGPTSNLVSNFANPGFPAGTNEQWVFKGKLAGDPLVVEVHISPGGLLSTTTIQPGNFSVAFVPESGGTPVDFFIRLLTVNNVVSASSLWEMSLVKNNSRTSLDLNTFGLAVNPLGVERIRATSFWVSNDQPYKGNKATFWIFFAGGPLNEWAGFCLKWESTNSGLWTFGPVPCDPDSLALIQGANAVAVYQDRVWFGNSTAAGRPQLIASRVGFMQAFDGALPLGPGTGRGVEVPWFVFKVVAETYTWTGTEPRINVNNAANLAGAALGSVARVDIHIPTNEPLVTPAALAAMPNTMNLPAPNLTVLVNGLPLVVTAAPFNLDALKVPPNPDPTNSVGIYDVGYGCWGVSTDNGRSGAAKSAFGGFAYFNDKTNGEAAGFSFPKAGDVLTFSTIPLAEDPLNLTLASPSGNVSWINVLRGLLLGTTRNEKLFSQEEALVIDPATGANFQAFDESNLGSDPALNALDVNDRVLFVQRGRQILRMANISITTSGGLIADDVGVSGEHLTEARIQTMCFLKTPVQRVILGFDDGTGAVMTLVGKSLAWSRFTVPAAYGGIYSVCALDSNYGSELFIGCTNGATLHWDSFESKIVSRMVFFPAGVPLPPTKFIFDPENPYPPVADGWSRCPVVDAASRSISGLSASLVGQSVYCFVNGQLTAPIVAVADGAGGAKVVLNDPTHLFTTVWTDENGVRRPQEVYAGLLYPEHRMTTLPLEGGNPTGTSQAKLSRKSQLYVRFVDSYLPLVNGERPEESVDGQTMDLLAARVTDDVRCTELNFQRAAVIDIVMDLPLRFEVTAVFGGTIVNSI